MQKQKRTRESEVAIVVEGEIGGQWEEASP